jgi:hypothetical protein
MLSPLKVRAALRDRSRDRRATVMRVEDLTALRLMMTMMMRVMMVY